MDEVQKHYRKTEKCMEQCGDCEHNWNFIKTDDKKGWCYMFTSYVPNCKQKVIAVKIKTQIASTIL